MGNSQEKPNFKELSKGTNFTTKELKAWYEKFKKDFPDGTVDKAEFSALYRKLYPGDPTACREFCEQVFRRYDADGSGLVDFREFMTTVNVATRGSSTEKLLWVFRLYDKNSNGYLLESEITDILTAVYKARNLDRPRDKAVDTARKIMAKADDTKDNKLSEAEFIHHANDCSEIREMLKSV